MLQWKGLPEVCWGIWVSTRDIEPIISAVERKGRERSSHCETTTHESSGQSIRSLFSSAELPCFSTRTRCVPAEIQMGRRLQTTLPCLATQNKRKYLKRKQKHLKLRQKANYDKASKSLEPLSNNDTVRLEDSNTWTKKATVLEEVKPRSYTVRTEDGQILRRNRRSLLKTKETVENTHTGDTDCAESTSETLPVLHHNEQAKEMHSPVLRRSNRTVKPPDRLNLWILLKQIRSIRMFINEKIKENVISWLLLLWW